VGDQKLELLGQLAVQQKLVTSDQLKLCLSEQTALRKTGRLVPLGQILVQRRFLTSDQIRRLLLNQKGVPTDAPLVNGKYALIRKLGKGGAGDVYLARDTTLDRPVAVKVLREEMSQNRKSVERFLREARVLARIRHPNVVGVHETGEYQGRPYFVMDYVDGTSLDAAMAPGAMSLRHKVEILQKVCGAVGELHRHGVVHRDLKPSNVIIDAKGNPILLDFGLAHDTSRHTKLTVTGTILGTPFYMAPEQVEGKPVDARTDVYALGVLLYETLTSRLPFRAENEFELYRQISSHEPPTPSTVEGRVPRDLEIVCLKAMDKDRSLRYQNASELADDLRRYLEGQPIHARPVPIAVKVWRRIKEHRIIASAVAGSLFVGVIVLAAFLVSRQGKSAEVRKLLTHAEQSFQKALLDEAENTYLRVLTLDQGNQAAREGLAKIRERKELIDEKLRRGNALMKSDPEEAEKLFGAILDLDARNKAAQYGLQQARGQKNLRAQQLEIDKFLAEVRTWITKYENDTKDPPEVYVSRNPALNLRDQISRIEGRFEEMDKQRQVEAKYLVGRIYVLLGEMEKAQENLDWAIASAPEQGLYYYERARLALSRYRREYATATQDAKRRGHREALEKLKKLRTQALEDFKVASTRPIGDWEKVLAKAFIHFHERRYPEALDECMRVTDHRDSSLLKLAGQIYLELAFDDPKNYRSAEETFRRAADIYRSDVEVRSGLGDTYLQQVQHWDDKSLDLALLDRAITEYDVALRLQPSADLELDLARAYLVRVEREVILGKDASESVDRAKKFAINAKNRNFNNLQTHYWLGVAHLHAATACIFRANGTPDLDTADTEVQFALTAFEMARSMDPKDAETYQSRAVARGVRGLLTLLQGRDAGRDLDLAQEDIAQALKLGLRSHVLYEAKAVTHLWKFVYLLSRARADELDKALPELDSAIEACDQSILSRWASERARTIVFRATLKMVRGLFGWMKWNREICASSMKSAAEDIREAGRLYGRYGQLEPEAFEAIGRAMVLQIDKKDPRAEYSVAREGLTKILASSAGNDTNLHFLRMFSLLLRGFANYSLERYSESVSDWETLCQRVPPFEALLSMWLTEARKKVKSGG